MQVWKFNLEVGKNVLSMPQKAEILSAKMQGPNICLWARCNVNAVLEKRTLEVYGTGWDIPYCYAGELIFIDTVITSNGQFVWHVFERVR